MSEVRVIHWWSSLRFISWWWIAFLAPPSTISTTTWTSFSFWLWSGLSKLLNLVVCLILVGLDRSLNLRKFVLLLFLNHLLKLNHFSAQLLHSHVLSWISLALRSFNLSSWSIFSNYTSLTVLWFVHQIKETFRPCDLVVESQFLLHMSPMMRCILISTWISELMTFTRMHQFEVSITLSSNWCYFSGHSSIMVTWNFFSIWSKLIEWSRGSLFSLWFFWHKLSSSFIPAWCRETLVFFKTLSIGLHHTSIGLLFITCFRPNFTEIRRSLVKIPSVSFHSFIRFLFVLVSLISLTLKCDFF